MTKVKNDYDIHTLMAKRVTIMLDDDLVKKLRELQAKELRKSEKNVSFSGILNQVLKKSL